MISVFSPSNKLIRFELLGDMAKFGGCKLRYFVVKRRKTLDPSYYWNAKGMEKYGLPNHQALGNDYQRAVANWQALYFEYCRKRRETKIYGFCTEQDKGLSDNKGTLIHMRELYFKDRRFLRLADKTKKDYTKTLENVVDKLLYKTQKAPLGTILVKDINRPFIKALYEKLLENGAKRSAQLTINAISQLIITAKDYGYFEGENPCLKLVMERNKPRNQIWTKEEVELFCDIANQRGYNGLALAVLIAYYTAQRETDIVKLKWKDFDSDLNVWKLNQSKTGARIELPISKMPILQQALKQTKRINEYVVNSADGMPYCGRELIPEQCKKIINLAGIRQELVFRDLRRTAILRLDEAGCTPSEIASISGHSRTSIIQMLETYAPKTGRKAENAINKLNEYEGRAS